VRGEGGFHGGGGSGPHSRRCFCAPWGSNVVLSLVAGGPATENRACPSPAPTDHTVFT